MSADPVHSMPARGRRCVCVCVCVRARAHVCVCVRARARECECMDIGRREATIKVREEEDETGAGERGGATEV